MEGSLGFRRVGVPELLPCPVVPPTTQCEMLQTVVDLQKRFQCLVHDGFCAKCIQSQTVLTRSGHPVRGIVVANSLMCRVKHERLTHLSTLRL